MVESMLLTWEIIFFLSSGFPSVCLYIFVIYQLTFNYEFKSSFFKIAIFMGIVDLSNYTCMWFSYKLIMYPLTAPLFFIGQNCDPNATQCVPKNNFCYVILFTSMYYFNKSRECLLVLTSFNRFSAICFPYHQEKIWIKFLWPLIIFCLIFPFCLTCNLFFGFAVILPFYEENDGTFVLSIRGVTWEFAFNGLLSSIHTIATSCISLIFNVTSLITLYLRAKRMSTKTVKIKKSEIKLLIISCIDFGLDFIAVSHQVWMYSFTFQGIFFHPIFDQLYLIYPWIYDILNLSRPYILIIICKPLQKTFVNLWKCKKHNHAQIVTIQIMSNH